MAGNIYNNLSGAILSPVRTAWIKIRETYVVAEE